MTKPPPFQVLSRRIVASNVRFNIRFDHLKSADEEVPAFLVVDPLSRSVDGCTGVAILPVVAGRVLLQHVYRHPLSRWGWEVPRGFVDEDESPIEAARRELAEETGLSCDVKALRLLGESSPDPGVINARMMIYAALDCQEAPQCRLPELGCDNQRLFSVEEVAAMAGSEALSCATTIASFYLYLKSRGLRG